MHTYLKIIYHVTFHTRNNRKFINKNWKEKLYKYIYGILNNNKCYCYQIGGTEDHIHIAFSLHPTICLSKLIHDIKLSSTKYVKKDLCIFSFGGWQSGYAAITHCEDSLENLKIYIRDQEIHHLNKNSRDEYKRHLKDAKIEFDEKYLF
jgi:REP-associated tyrosine transposase